MLLEGVADSTEVVIASTINLVELILDLIVVDRTTSMYSLAVSGSMAKLTAVPALTMEDLNQSNSTRPNLRKISSWNPSVPKLVDIDSLGVDVV